MGMTVKHDKKANRKVFTYKGDLEKAMKQAEKELREKANSQKRVFLEWQYKKTQKERDAYEQRIEDLKDFIELAKEKLEEKNEADK